MKEVFSNSNSGSTSIHKTIALYTTIISIFSIIVSSVSFFIIMIAIGIEQSKIYNAIIIYLLITVFTTGLIVLLSFIVSSQLANKIVSPINSFKNFLHGQIMSHDISKFYSPENTYAELHDLIMTCNKLISEYKERSKQINKSFSLIMEKVSSSSNNIGKIKQIEQNQSQSISSINQLVTQISNTILDISEPIAMSNKTEKRTLKGISEIYKMVNHLNPSINNMNSILSFIQQVANQTNMLSVNAAIEASKAGDSGKGISAVADELRNLSEKVSESALSAEEIIGGLNKAISDIKILVLKNIDSGESTLNEVSEKISARLFTLNQSISSINYGFENHNSIIQEVVIAIHDIVREVKQN